MATQFAKDLAKIESQNAEIKRLKAEANRSKAAIEYKARVDGLVLGGCKRGRAVEIASQENPVGKAAYLVMTNRPGKRATIEAATVGQPLHSGSDLDRAKAAIFEEHVTAELKSTRDRRSAILNAGRAHPRLHAAWCRTKTGEYANTR